MNPDKPFIKAIDALRVISILGVVLIHTTTKILESSGYNLLGFQLTLFLNQFVRFAVPLFFIISGFVLELNYSGKMDYITYIKKRFIKIFIPYLFWSLIYYFFVYTNNTDNFLRIILTGDASYQLYFIPAICLFYLVFPLLHKFFKILSSPAVLTILGGLEIVFMRQDYFIHQFSYIDPLRIFLLGYFFFIAGMFLSKHKDNLVKIADKLKYFLIPLAVYLSYYIFKEGLNRYFKTYNIEAFYSQWRPDVLIYTFLIFIILFYFFEKSNLEFRITREFSRLSYFVFFIHVMVLEIVWKYISHDAVFLMNAGLFNQILVNIILFTGVTTFSFTAAYVAHKIPVVNKITG